MRAAALFVGAAAIGLAGAAGSTLLFPPHASNANVSVAIAPGPVGSGVNDKAAPLPDSTPEALPSVAALAPTPWGGSVLVCTGYPQVPLNDGRLINHIPYAQDSANDLVAPPDGFGGGNCAQIDREMKGALTRMIADATRDDPAVGKSMKGVSCFRSVERQRGLFCNPAKLAARGVAGQAKWVAPGGFSEHATGFAIDFGVKSMPQCDVSPCFANTRTGQWLAANARRYGFELSFPSGNKQGVSFEPWHWRWTGSDRAKAVFARARRDFPSP